MKIPRQQAVVGTHIDEHIASGRGIGGAAVG